ncbi:MAG: outer membrane beta-barrel protein [Candidatus Lustribacter sp.]
MKLRAGIAYLAVIVGAIALWNASPAGADPVVAQAAPAPSPSPTATPPPHAFQFSGFADAGYTSASIASAVGSPNGSFINGRVFDDLNNQIQFHDFNLQAAYNGPIGGKVEAIFGDDANVTNSWPKSQLDGAPSLNGTGSALSGPDIDLTQAYLSLTSGQFTGIVGRFETLAGAEVIESPSDIEFSRSILFGYAVPFTHTGGRLTWAMNSNISFIVGLNKGWDTTGQLNAPYNNFPGAAPYNDTSSLTFEGGAIWNPSKYFSATLDGYTGQTEEGYAVAVPGAFVVSPARPVKSLVDNVLTWKPTSSLTFILNSDYGTQTNSNIFGTTGALVGYGMAKWGGVAGYASYALSGQWTASLRGEIFEDYGGTRSGITQTWTEATATLQWSPNSNLIVRGEIRGDNSTEPFFVGANGIYKTNDQFGIETILKYP